MGVSISTGKYDNNIYSTYDGKHFPPKDANAEAEAKAKEEINLEEIQGAIDNVNSSLLNGIDDVSSNLNSIAADSDKAIQVSGVGIAQGIENFTSNLASISVDANSELGDVMGAAEKSFQKKWQEYYDTLQEQYNSEARSERDAYDARIRKEREAAEAAAQGDSN